MRNNLPPLWGTPLLAGLFLAASASAQIPRTDTLECGLLNGEKFILKGHYTYLPLADLLTPHGQEKTNRRGWFVEFGGKNKKIKFKDEQGDQHPWGYYSPSSGAGDNCAHLGMRKGQPIAKDRFLNAQGVWEHYFKAGSHNAFSTLLTQDMKKSLNEQKLERLDDHGFMFEEPKGVRVYEVPLRSTANDPPEVNGRRAEARQYDWRVAAVLQRRSLDGGQTWSPDIVTANALLYEFGATRWDQCFLARPIRFNGKPTEAIFPACASRP